MINLILKWAMKTAKADLYNESFRGRVAHFLLDYTFARRYVLVRKNQQIASLKEEEQRYKAKIRALCMICAELDGSTDSYTLEKLMRRVKPGEDF